MKTSLLPKSRRGAWSAGLISFTLSVFIFFYVFAELLHFITSDIVIRIFGALAVIASLIAIFIGVAAVIKNKERSFLVFLAILIGLVVLAFIVGDISGLHKG